MCVCVCVCVWRYAPVLQMMSSNLLEVLVPPVECVLKNTLLWPWAGTR